MNQTISFFLFFSTLLLFNSCKDSPAKELPILGHKSMVNGDQEYHTIPDWKYATQDNIDLTNKDLSNVIYVADFFFISCPSICPKVMKEMTKIYKEFENIPGIKLVSFTLDPKRDTPEKLKAYAQKLGVSNDKWIFLHTDKESIYDLAAKYFVPAYEDKNVPGGFDHSGKIILVDHDGHVRSFSEGTDASNTPKLIKDIKTLLKEYETK
ncbi:MAG: SCO family protein [Saprospiraceae bacterium]